MRHTPGPWHFEGDSLIAVEPNGDRALLCRLVGLLRGDGDLIAAAPDLLAALKTMADDEYDVSIHSHCVDPSNPDLTEWNEADPVGYANWQAAKAAIARAEGLA